MANRYYALLAGAVDVQATDEADVADVQRQGDGSVALRLSRRDGARYYVRTFHPGETSEVRLYLHDGDDRVVVRGSGRGAITLRVITGAGHSALIDSTRSGRTFFYVDHTPARVISGPRSSVDRGAPRGGPQQDPLKLQLRDWGTRWSPAVRLSFAPDLGVLAGGGETGTWVGFRQDPFKSQLGVGVSYAAAAPGFRGALSGGFRGVLLGMDAR